MSVPVLKTSYLFLACIIALVFASAAGAQNPANEPFTFTDVDLMLLEQVDLLDAKLQKDGLVYSEHTLDVLLTRIGTAVVPSGASPERVTWRFRALRDPTPNAFALPNGSIYVHTGLIALFQNEHELAGVLAHEVTHVVDRHAYLAFRSYRKKAVAANLISLAAGAVPFVEVASQAWGLALRVISATVPSILAATVEGYSRELERAADLYAVDKLIAAGYDPTEMVSAFRHLQTPDDIEADTLFYTDHPKLAERIADVTAVVEARGAARLEPEALADVSTRYVGEVESALRQNITLAIAASRLRSAVATARKLQTFAPDASQSAYSLAEAYRALGPLAPEPTGEELTEKGRKDARKRKERLTPQEERKALLATPAGQAAWEQNQREAEKWYRRALELDPPRYEAYRGLGLLFEENRVAEAVDAFEQYLAFAPDARDRSQVLRRLEKLRGILSRRPSDTAR